MDQLRLWGAILVIVFSSSAGEVLLSHTMKRIGDLHELREREGLWAVITRTMTAPLFWPAIACLAVGFFSLITALSWGDASLVAPASASLTLVLNAALAKIILREDVDRRRWLSALLVCIGVALLAQ